MFSYIYNFLKGIVWFLLFIFGIFADWKSGVEQLTETFVGLQTINFIGFIDAAPYIAGMGLVFLYIIYRTKIVVMMKSTLWSPFYISNEIHEFQHIYDKFIDEINTRRKAGENVELDSQFCRQRVYQLLVQIRRSLSIVSESETSVNIKIPVRLDSKQTTELMECKDIMLKTYERAPSPKENKDTSGDGDKKSKKRARSNKEHFLLPHDSNPTWITEHKANCTKGHNRCNTAYSHVLGTGEHSWISNNLNKSMKKGLFMNTSNEWKKYYNSLAVVAIAPHQLKMQGKIDDSFGIIIADSIRTNAFRKHIVQKVLGYYAHRLYRLLKHIELSS